MLKFICCSLLRLTASCSKTVRQCWVDTWFFLCRGGHSEWPHLLCTDLAATSLFSQIELTVGAANEVDKIVGLRWYRGRDTQTDGDKF